MRRLVLILAVLAITPSASAMHTGGHFQPAGPAVQHFPPDFAVPIDTEWPDWELGGFGETPDTRTDHLPVVFVHGNNTDHATWFLVASRMTEELGWGFGDLWALSFNGVGCTNEGALFTPNTGYRGWTYQEDRAASTGCVVTSNDTNVSDLKAFIDEVLAYTGAEKLHIVSHSLGVTVARKTLWEFPELYERVAGFVAIAGANHGTSFCPPGSEGNVNSCDEIAADTPWLAEINDGPKAGPVGAAGSNETPGPTRWMTAYDGTGAGDPAFAGDVYAQSPRLEGALNCEYPNTYHNDLRVDAAIVDVYVGFLEAVEADQDYTCAGIVAEGDGSEPEVLPAVEAQGDPTPQTGGGIGGLVGLFLAVAGLVLRKYYVTS